ncbi:SUN domain-containing protein 1-like isoform X2 [Cryptotermes secundus]|uniref:SUN domain-containing protein 1-like isoform X2 n=2 Tax=Cryptotermes secundus TaxID=105785 RepID=UPI000CD7B686|nr:SUN domain-containing protein 1-like isoform X2 [Cryptotermes secundus]XP_023717730.1 SUN domain-containing protein 1-like isoform X2 [Cryptotermes secundus]
MGLLPMHCTWTSSHIFRIWIMVLKDLAVVGSHLVCLFWPTTRDMEQETGVLRQEVHFLRTELSMSVLRQELNFLRTELSSGLFTLRGEVHRDLLNLLQTLDTGTSYEVYGNLEDTSKKIVQDAIRFYDSTKTGQLDFALESLGGSVVSTRNTKEYKLSSPFGTWDRSAQHIIQPCMIPGECWAFEGSGTAVIQLIGEVNITAVSIEHASPDTLPPEGIKSAPKDFSVWGLNSLNDKGHYLGSFSYDISGSPLQYYTIQEPAAIPFRLIELKIHNNHGNPSYTCLYRFRVHGTMEPLVQA